MPLGTGKISKSNYELARVLDDYKRDLLLLQEATKELAFSTQNLTKEMQMFNKEMKKMSQELEQVHKSMDRFSGEFSTNMKELNKNLHDFGRMLAQSMLENVKDSLDVRKLVSSFLRKE